MKNGHRLNIIDYREYRSFLKDWLSASKQSRGALSYRRLAKKAGFKSTNFIMLVIQGKRNLTEESIKKLAVGLGLHRNEEEFFRNLVFLNQAETHVDKDFYYRRLLQSKKLSQQKPIEREHYEYYSTWYHPVVRELVAARHGDGNPEWIAKRLHPAVSVEKVVQSITLLEHLGFIVRTSDGKWQQASSIVSTGPELTSMVVHNYHKSILDLSKQLMDELTMQHRDVSTLTLGVRREQIEELRTKIREFRKDMLRLASATTEPEEVVQLNIQFFPVTKTQG